MGRVKKKDHEKLSSANIEHVISLLNPEDGSQPITKKEACSILNISYNTTRLGKIIDEHKEKQANIAKRKAANRGRPADKIEIQQAVSEYLNGSPVSEIAKGLFRSPAFVKGIIERVGVPQRPTTKEGKTGVDFIPDECVADEFTPGEIVWSARHHTTAIIKHELSLEYQEKCKGMKSLDYEKKYGAKAYNIYVTEAIDSTDSFFPFVEHGGYNATVLAYDLGKLTHLEEFGVDLSRI